jgi:hypothetical protein
MVPDKRWWEITDCDFYTEMFNTGDFNSVINCIIDELKTNHRVLEALPSTCSIAVVNCNPLAVGSKQLTAYAFT